MLAIQGNSSFLSVVLQLFSFVFYKVVVYCLSSYNVNVYLISCCCFYDLRALFPEKMGSKFFNNNFFYVFSICSVDPQRQIVLCLL